MVSLSRKKKDTRKSLDLTPLIDIIFNLLIFFLITAVLSAKGMDLDLPEADSSEKMPPRSIEIAITEDGRLMINREELPWEHFEQMLEIERDRGDLDARKVIVKAEKEVPFRLFIKVMDAARMKGFTNLVIATDTSPVEMDEK